MADQPTDVFSNDPTPLSDPQQQPSPSNIFEDQLKNIKNENGEQKYDSLPKALEGLANAQSYIPQLKTELQTKEAELAELRKQLEGRASVEEVVSRLTAQQESQKAPEQTPAQEAQGLDEKAVAEMFNRFTSQQAKESLSASNAERVRTALTEKFGDKAQEAVQQKAKELGMTPDGIRALASQSPQAALALFGGASLSPQPTTSSLNFPLSSPAPQELKRPEKSLLSGASSKEQAAFMRQIKEEIYRKYEVKT